LLDGDRRISKDAARGAERHLVVKWNRSGHALRFIGMAKTNVAALLAHADIAELAQSTIRSAPETTGSFGLIG
jgi:hypothetical protein